MKPKIYILLISTILLALSGCASAPMASTEKSNTSKQFIKPSTGNAGIYIYRDGNILGGQFKQNITIDETIIGALPTNTFLHREIKSGEHTIAAQGMTSATDIKFTAEEGRNYFFRNYIPTAGGMFVGGLEAVTENEGKIGVLDSEEIR